MWQDTFKLEIHMKVEELAGSTAPSGHVIEILGSDISKIDHAG
jgi:hypothetical protein